MTERRSSRLAAIAANGVFATHFLLVVFAVGGGFLVLVSPVYAIVHVPLLIWVAFVNFANWTCPLTPLEQQLRLLAGQTSFETSWTRKYCEPLIRFSGLSGRLETAVGISILVWNGLVYAWVLYRI